MLRHHGHRPLSLVAMVAATVAALAGCAAPRPGNRPVAARPAGRVPPPGSSATLPDPLDRYLPSAADQSVIETGLARAVTACVRRHGIQAPVTMRVRLAPLLAYETNLANIAGSLPLATAQRSGYTSAAAASGTPLLALDAGWSVAYHLPAADSTLHAKLTAVLRGGCLSSGIGAVVGGQPPAAQLANDVAAVPLFLTERADQEMQNDDRVKGVTARWQACMRRAGYAYSSPAAAEADPRWLGMAGRGASLARVARLERPVAMADARCRGSVGYTHVRLAVFDDDLDRLIAGPGMRVRLGQFRAMVSRCVHNLERADG